MITRKNWRLPIFSCYVFITISLEVYFLREQRGKISEFYGQNLIIAKTVIN